MPYPADTAEATIARRVAALREAYAAIAAGSMAGLPLCHPGLGVEAIGFAPWPPEPDVDGAPEPPQALGVLLTPWCMNLVCLPLVRNAGAPPVGQVRPRRLAGQRLDFIGAQLPAVGGFAACSLFSPMAEFADHASARATAQAALALLRPEAPAPVAATAPGAPARRAFLFGRGRPATAGA